MKKFLIILLALFVATFFACKGGVPVSGDSGDGGDGGADDNTHTLTIIFSNADVTADGDDVTSGTPMTFDHNMIVAITVTPNDNFTMNGWIGDDGSDVQGTGPYTIEMDSDKVIEAQIVDDSTTFYDLTVSFANATISANSTNLTTNTPMGFEEGTIVTLEVTPDDNFQFDEWSGDDSADVSGSGPYTIVMSKDRALTANISSTQGDYTLTISIVGSGSVTTDPVGTSFAPGTTVSLYPNPDTNWLFNEWTGDNSGDIYEENFTKKIDMDSNKTLTANFVSDDATNASLADLTFSTGMGLWKPWDPQDTIDTGFDYRTFYTLTVKDTETGVDITAVPEASTVTSVTINGSALTTSPYTYNLDLTGITSGDIIDIVILAEDGTTSETYNLEVFKAAPTLLTSDLTVDSLTDTSNEVDWYYFNSTDTEGYAVQFSDRDECELGTTDCSTTSGGPYGADIDVTVYKQDTNALPYSYKVDNGYLTPTQITAEGAEVFIRVGTETGAYGDYAIRGYTTTNPVAPTGLSASDGTGDDIAITWNDVSADTYEIYYSTTETGTYSLLDTATTNSYTDVNPGQIRYYKVRGKMNSEDLCSDFSNIDSGSPTDVSDPISFVETIQTSFADEQYGEIRGLAVTSNGSNIYVSSGSTGNPTWNYDVSGDSYTTLSNLAYSSDLAMSSDDKLYYKGYSGSYFYAQATNGTQDWSYTGMPTNGSYPVGGNLDVLGSSSDGKFYFAWEDGNYAYSVIRLTLTGSAPASHDEVLTGNMTDVAADLNENLYVITSLGDLKKYNYASGADSYTVDTTVIDISSISPDLLITDHNATEEHLYVLGSDKYTTGDKAKIQVYRCSDLSFLDEIVITEHCVGLDTYEDNGTTFILTAALTDSSNYIWDVHKFRRD